MQVCVSGSIIALLYAAVAVQLALPSLLRAVGGEAPSPPLAVERLGAAPVGEAAPRRRGRALVRGDELGVHIMLRLFGGECGVKREGRLLLARMNDDGVVGDGDAWLAIG